MNSENKKDEIKEDFCPVCIAAIPLAFGATGAGASKMVDSKDKDDDNCPIKKRKKHFLKILFWSSIALSIVSVLVIIYFKFIKQCEECA